MPEVMSETRHRYEHILLDADGTLVNNLDLIVDAKMVGLHTLGYRHVGIIPIINNLGDWENLFDTIGMGYDPEERLSTQDYINDIIQQIGPDMRLFDGAHDLLDSAHEFADITIVSNSTIGPLQGLLDRCGLTRLIDHVFCGDDVECPKPDPEIVHLAMKTLGATALNTIVIGDSANDVIAASEAGIDSMLVAHEENQWLHQFTEAELDSRGLAPSVTVKNLYEAKEFLEQATL